VKIILAPASFRAARGLRPSVETVFGEVNNAGTWDCFGSEVTAGTPYVRHGVDSSAVEDMKERQHCALGRRNGRSARSSDGMEVTI